MSTARAARDKMAALRAARESGKRNYEVRRPLAPDSSSRLSCSLGQERVHAADRSRDGT